MTDKEFKRLNRSQLIDIIYQLQLKQEELTAENEKLSKALDDKRLRVSKAGNIAEAALEIHNVMQAAQDAAEHYLEEIRRMREATEKNCQLLLEKARKEADDILAQAKNGDPSDPSQLEEIVKEFGQNNEATGEGT
jgi:cell division septum initiation protein DivIVA